MEDCELFNVGSTVMRTIIYGITRIVLVHRHHHHSYLSGGGDRAENKIAMKESALFQG